MIDTIAAVAGTVIAMYPLVKNPTAGNFILCLLYLVAALSMLYMGDPEWITG